MIAMSITGTTTAFGSTNNKNHSDRNHNNHTTVMKATPGCHCHSCNEIRIFETHKKNNHKCNCTTCKKLNKTPNTTKHTTSHSTTGTWRDAATHNNNTNHNNGRR